jgi:hypothetical protein
MSPSDQIEKELVDSTITGQLGMEGGGKDIALTDHDRVLIDAGKDLDLGAYLLDPGGANEDGVKRLIQAFDL